MKSIWKFFLATTDEQVLEMPAGAQVLAVQAQGGVPCLWALVETTAHMEARRFEIYGTGHPVAADTGAAEYVGTYQLGGGALIFHVFDKGRAAS